MQSAEFTCMKAPKPFPNASPWVSLKTPNGKSVRAFLHVNGYVYFVACDVGRFSGCDVKNHDRVRELFGAGHVMRDIVVPRAGGSLLLVSEAGMNFILARHGYATDALRQAHRWLVTAAVPTIKQAAQTALMERMRAEAQAAIWETKQ